MAGQGARPVPAMTINQVRHQLEQYAKRLERAIEIMNESKIEELEIRAHVAMTRGMQALGGMAAEVLAKAEDAQLSAKLGIPTKVKVNRERHAKYDKFNEPKAVSKKRKPS